MSCNLPLSFLFKLSTQPFFRVEAGSTCSVRTPSHPSHSRTALAASSDPLPEQVWSAILLTNAMPPRTSNTSADRVRRAAPDCLTLLAVFADECQQTCISAVIAAQLHEAVCLNVVRPFGTQRRCSRRSPWSSLTGAEVWDGSCRTVRHECAFSRCREATSAPPGPGRPWEGRRPRQDRRTQESRGNPQPAVAPDGVFA